MDRSEGSKPLNYAMDHFSKPLKPFFIFFYIILFVDPPIWKIPSCHSRISLHCFKRIHQAPKIPLDMRFPDFHKEKSVIKSKIPLFPFSNSPFSPGVKPMDPGTIPIRSASSCYIDFIVLRPVGIYGGIKYGKKCFCTFQNGPWEPTPPPQPKKVV